MGNFDLNFWLGVLGGAVLVVGSAWPLEKVKHPAKSVKNWLFALGALLLFSYSLLNYLDGRGEVFFVFLEFLAIVASVLMMIGSDDKVDNPIIAFVGLILVGWSLYLFEDYTTILIVLGIVAIALGYVMDAATLKRNLALFLGGILISVFSYLVKDWIFFWLNAFFAAFSSYYSWKLAFKKK
ncbi:hypothetical protein HY605_04820 [Candidatus Peregrinibacteria bacterium]|nr:hypothetical protein [Candidatus Peregrinibacteria bacterium]